MSGHSHWSQVKHQKAVTDQKRGGLFSKLLKAIAIAAKSEPNPNFNPRLRTAVETAKQNNVPKDNIDRAISKAAEEKNLEELVIEAYGPEKVAIIIEAITDNRNRTTNEVRSLIAENSGKMGEMGCARWAFEPPQPGSDWTPKFTQTLSEDGKEKLQKLIAALEAHDDVQKTFNNAGH